MRSLQSLVLAVALLVAAFLIGRCSAPRIAPEREVVEKVDTVVVRDTITREKPVYRTKYVRDSICVYVRDTVTITMPREVRVYEDSLYRAEVSGYDPSLDRIEVYAQTKVVTKDITKVVKVRQPNRWGIGVQVGYGITKQGQSFYPGPYIGVGVSYNLITW